MRILIAAPQQRHDATEITLQAAGYETARVKGPEELTFARLTDFDPHYIFFLHWHWMIPAEIHANFECVIFHMTDLPFGRGGSPLQNLIVRGYEETKLTAIRCVEELDAGPVYIQRPLSLTGTAEEILTNASKLAVDMILEILEKQPKPKPQAGHPTIFKRRKPEDGDLSSLDNLKSVYDYIRMLDADGYPNAFIENKKLKFEFCKARSDTNEITATVKILLKDKK